MKCYCILKRPSHRVYPIFQSGFNRYTLCCIICNEGINNKYPYEQILIQCLKEQSIDVPKSVNNT